ncbi:hypothetical protein GCM10025863_32830 [Microbacterium suwonense]|uniref:Uncharacterized protein n=1 Tax=Microbacterium suwonense TaxID=683047 RepID=A0ABN6X7I4_9MICO|nr:hypothetical protein GCM10025863_32830 [Microbacterium suwonense]
MGDHDHAPALVGELLDHQQHLADQFRVERAGGLVEEQQIGAERERADDPDALLLTAGELMRSRILLVGKTDPIQQQPSRVDGLPLGRPCTRQGPR